MDKINRKNFKAFQTPSGASDPVRPDRPPQAYPGNFPDKSTQEQPSPNHLPDNPPDSLPEKENGNAENTLKKDSVGTPGTIPDFEEISRNAGKVADSLVPDPEDPLQKGTDPETEVPENKTNDAMENGAEAKHQEEEYQETYDGSYDDNEEYEENDIRSWFYTFMCMNIPIYGWIYLKRLADGRIPAPLEQQDFAEAYLYYKRFFLKISAVILIILIIIAAVAINKLLAYMQML